MSDGLGANRDDAPAFLDDPVRMEVRRGRLTALTTVGRNTERLVFFSDAVFAIALTLLVLDIRIPEVTDDELPAALIEVMPRFVAFVISFIVIIGAWLTHFRRFRLTTGYDSGTIGWNTLLLFLVCLVPFPTSVFASHTTAPATMLYGGSVGLIFAVQALSWRHAWRADHLSPQVDRGMYVRTRNSLGGLAVAFLGSIPLALIAPWLTWLAWSCCAPFVPMLASRLGRPKV